MFNPYLVLGFSATVLLAGILFIWWDERTARPRRRASAHRR